jgi:hypothetical protein
VSCAHCQVLSLFVRDGERLPSVQVFLDCVEQFNLMVNSKGDIVHSELKGALEMKAYLSGMPECKLGLNDKTMFARQVRTVPHLPRDIESRHLQARHAPRVWGSQCVA